MGARPPIFHRQRADSEHRLARFQEEVAHNRLTPRRPFVRLDNVSDGAHCAHNAVNVLSLTKRDREAMTVGVAEI